MKKAEFMVVRKYIIDAIATANGIPLRFPPSRKLGEKLGVSQPTVSRAVNDLIAQGYLVKSPGGGTLSNPLTGNNQEMKIFGMVSHLGDQSFYNRYFLSMMHAVSFELTRRSNYHCVQDIVMESPSLLERTVREDSLSAVVMLDAKEKVAGSAITLKSNGTPVASFMKSYKGISSFYSPVSECFGDVLKKLFGEKRTHVLIVGWNEDYYINGIEEGIRNACRECNVPEGHVIYLHSNMRDIRKKVKEMLGFGLRFEAAIFSPFNQDVYDMIQNVASSDECRFVCEETSVSREMNYSGYAISFDLQSGAIALVDDLLGQMKDPKKEPVDIHINHEIKEYKEGNVI